MVNILLVMMIRLKVTLRLQSWLHREAVNLPQSLIQMLVEAPSHVRLCLPCQIIHLPAGVEVAQGPNQGDIFLHFQNCKICCTLSRHQWEPNVMLLGIGPIGPLKMKVLPISIIRRSLGGQHGPGQCCAISTRAA